VLNYFFERKGAARPMRNPGRLSPGGLAYSLPRKSDIPHDAEAALETGKDYVKSYGAQPPCDEWGRSVCFMAAVGGGETAGGGGGKPRFFPFYPPALSLLVSMWCAAAGSPDEALIELSASAMSAA
jgi:hypothetical protein